MTEPLHLETARLHLRPLTLADVPRICLLAGDEAVSAMALGIPFPLTEADAQEWVADAARGLATGREYVFALIEKASGLMIGSAALTLDKAQKKAELGYWLGQPYWGHGYATEAAARLLQFGFGQLHLHRIFANHNGNNPGSGHVMRKLGMKCEGTLRDHVWHRGQYLDLVYYGLLRSEYGGAQHHQP